MDDNNDDSESEVGIPKKRKYNILNDDDTDNSDDEDDDEDEDEESDSDDDDDDDDDDESDEYEDNPCEDGTFTDDVNNEQCAVCLMEFTDQKVGIPNICTHVFCLVCIQEWAKNINTCPVDRRVFYTITVKIANNEETVEKIKVEDRTQIKDEYEDPTTCEICGTGDREDRMLLCDGCDRGFHLECLTPPLDSVPEEEWFCRDCFLDNTQQNILDNDSIDYSQHAIAFSDDELSPTLESRSKQFADSSVSSTARPSTSQQRRARTVATSRRRRRRRRRRTQGSRQTGQQSKKKKTNTLVKGENSTTTRTPKQKRKKRKRKRSRRKKIKADDAAAGSSKTTDRYLLPREMEPTATFSLFGSDFDLEYLPIVESPAPVVTTHSTPLISTATGNPDVLGSIFTGLDTLHSESLTVDKDGRVRIEENKMARQSEAKPKVLRKQNTSKEKKEKKDQRSSSLLGSSARCCSREMFGRCSIHRNRAKGDSNSSSPRKCKGNETAVREFVNDKRLKRFGTSSSSSVVNMANDDGLTMSVAKSRINPPKTITDKDIEKEENTKFSQEPSKTMLKASQHSFTSYKIPKKNPTSTAPNIPVVNVQNAESFNFKPTSVMSKSPMKPPRIRRKKLKLPEFPEESSGILHLLPTGTATKTWLDNKQKILEPGPTALKTNNKKTVQSSWSEPNSKFLNPDDRNLSQGTNYHIRLSSSKKREGKETSSNPLISCSTPSTANIRKINHGSNSQSIKQNPSSQHGNNSKQYLENSTTAANIAKARSSTRQTTADVQSSRPVAVVYPTKISGKVREGNSYETEAAKRRREGIERLKRKQLISDELKEALKPFYRHKEISKDDYKYIYGRAFEKISQSPLPVVSRDVASLVKNYVKKLKGRQLSAKAKG